MYYFIHLLQISSDPSPQSLLPSHSCVRGMHVKPSAHSQFSGTQSVESKLNYVLLKQPDKILNGIHVHFLPSANAKSKFSGCGKEIE